LTKIAIDYKLNITKTLSSFDNVLVIFSISGKGGGEIWLIVSKKVQYPIIS